MILLRTSPETTTRSKVYGAHFQPENLGLSKEELESDGGILVEEYLEPQDIEGKMSTHYINPQTGEQWVEYEDIPKTEIELLKEENTNLKLAVAELAESQEQAKLETQLALAELAESLVGGV